MALRERGAAVGLAQLAEAAEAQVALVPELSAAGAATEGSASAVEMPSATEQPWEQVFGCCGDGTVDGWTGVACGGSVGGEAGRDWDPLPLRPARGDQRRPGSGLGTGNRGAGGKAGSEGDALRERDFAGERERGSSVLCLRPSIRLRCDADGCDDAAGCAGSSSETSSCSRALYRLPPSEAGRTGGTHMAESGGAPADERILRTVPSGVVRVDVERFTAENAVERAAATSAFSNAAIAGSELQASELVAVQLTAAAEAAAKLSAEVVAVAESVLEERGPESNCIGVTSASCRARTLLLRPTEIRRLLAAVVLVIRLSLAAMVLMEGEPTATQRAAQGAGSGGNCSASGRKRC
eukprot:7391959-Prymnesium_polylepis.3